MVRALSGVKWNALTYHLSIRTSIGATCRAGLLALLALSVACSLSGSPRRESLDSLFLLTTAIALAYHRPLLLLVQKEGGLAGLLHFWHCTVLDDGVDLGELSSRGALGKDDVVQRV
jgi:hypothetical protein